MLIRLIQKCSKRSLRQPTGEFDYLEYDLIDVLRELCRCSWDEVMGRYWLLQEINFYSFKDDHETNRLQVMFPEIENVAATEHCVSGERLLERSATLSWFQTGLIMRVVEPTLPVKINEDFLLNGGPSCFQATNIDLEIRCDESPIEIVTYDEALSNHLQFMFSKTEIFE